MCINWRTSARLATGPPMYGKLFSKLTWFKIALQNAQPSREIWPMSIRGFPRNPLAPVPRFERGNPKGNHLLQFIKGYGPAFVGGLDASVNGGQGFGVNFDFLSYRYLEFQVNHIPTVAGF